MWNVILSVKYVIVYTKIWNHITETALTVLSNNIGIDETNYKKRHNHITVVVNHDISSVIWCAIEYGKEVLKKFFGQLSEEQGKSTRCVSANCAQWIADCVSEYCPNAERCIDLFHVVSWATEALYKVRRQAWAETQIRNPKEQRQIVLPSV